MNYKTQSELGLTDEDLLDFEKSKVYWQQFPPEEFIMGMVSNIKETIAGVQMWTFLLKQHPKKSAIKIEDACNAIEYHQAKAIRLLDISSEYAGSIKNNKL